MNDKLKDLMKASDTASSQQPPTGVNVTEVTSKDVSANVLNKAEAKEQAQVKAASKVLDLGGGEKKYKFELEEGKHKLVIVPEEGLNYNYHAKCSCAWEGRYLTSALAEAGAKQHIEVNIPRRG